MYVAYDVLLLVENNQTPQTVFEAILANYCIDEEQINKFFSTFVRKVVQPPNMVLGGDLCDLQSENNVVLAESQNTELVSQQSVEIMAESQNTELLSPQYVEIMAEGQIIESVNPQIVENMAESLHYTEIETIKVKSESNLVIDETVKVKSKSNLEKCDNFYTMVVYKKIFTQKNALSSRLSFLKITRCDQPFIE